jgi:hypothetical protein
MSNEKSVFGIFKSKPEVEKAVDLLKQAEFRSMDISVLMPEMGDTKSFAHKKDTKAPEGATTGAATGAVVGSGLGWLVGIGALAIPGVGPFIAAGPIVAALAGAGIGGTVGGITGALIGLGIPEYEAKRYEGFVKDGGILISVHTADPEWRERAKDILKAAGAEDISCANEVKGRSTNVQETPPASVYPIN